MANFPILPSSDKAIAARTGRTMYPFNQLEVGQSFAVDFSSSAYNSLRANASKRNRSKEGPQFRVIKHGDVIEVARVA